MLDIFLLLPARKPCRRLLRLSSDKEVRLKLVIRPRSPCRRPQRRAASGHH